MSGPGEKILLCSLWQRTSERGNSYLSGFLGKARLIGFRGEPTADGTPTWDLYLTPGKDQETAREQRSRPAVSTSGVQRHQRPPAPPGPPLPDDGVADLWREGDEP
jgi:hypothetical protein